VSNKVVVVDYGIGNVFSVCNALRQIDAEVSLARDKAEILAADRLILPGVGAFARAMEALKDLNLIELLQEYDRKERPFLGICIGMQVLMQNSEEFGRHDGLGFIKGTVERIDKNDDRSIRVPHIAWTGLQPNTERTEDSWKETPLEEFKSGQESVYFVHSYHCKPSDPSVVLARAEYEGLGLTAVINKDNIYGAQFHPERSGLVGQRFLKGFMNL
jgi:glutamine amidotransferase